MAGPANSLPRVGGLVDPVAAPAPSRANTPTQPPAPGQFERALREAAGGQSQPVRFSNHALARLERRGLQPDITQLHRLQHSTDLAASKGSRSALVLVDDLAFVVAVPARTVVTALSRAHMKEQVFTSIDTAVIG